MAIKKQDNPDIKRLSKFVALMLRHEPEQFGLVMDSQGFTDLDAVWEQVKKRFGVIYSRHEFEKMLFDTEGGRQRYEVIDNQVRAMYGHSAVTVDYAPVVPPEVLYHGTVSEVLKHIREEGLTAQKRQYVHLSTDTDRASNVAQRHGKAVLLKIRALEAHNAGHVFHNPEPKHYLVKAIPPEFIDFPE